MSDTRRISQLKEQEIEEIYSEWRSGWYYASEIMKKHKITHRTLQQIIEYCKGEINGR